MPKDRFVVYGCRPEDEIFTEIHTDDFESAVSIAMVNTSHGYTARIWDNERQVFIRQRVIERAIEFYGKR
jgi:hypothetical protein